ncbi:polysaccharide deacetylase family protein [Paenibacillus turpanensis]|uniref:polysaccharide deacetylase family protein n=1 Tax=Paenibacillus turpanensis TaxID=2689078 RepID=UPI001A9D5DB5|nr:polysaccharide deacetylase family protein [Paenibacillus turpanensis]
MKLIASMLILSLAVGCGGNTETKQSPQTAEKQAQPQAGAGGTADPSSKTPDQTPEQSAPAKPADQAAGQVTAPEKPAEQPASPAPQQAEAPQVLYTMNKIYSIVPKEGSDAPKKVVLLTFDDGPKEKELLTSILDTLDKHKAKAIFFVNGYRVKANPDLLTLIHERGQVIGNHSWDHIDLKKQTNEKIDQQIADVQKAVKEITGTAPKFFRPPHGSSNEHVKNKAKEEGMLFMNWSNGSRDWEKGYDKPEKVIASVMEQLGPGSNILMHELPWTAEALDSLLTQLKEKGYGFVDPNTIDTTVK